MAMTALDAKIERLQKELKETKAAKVVATRKERNSQLIGFGVLMEKIFKTATPEQRESLKKKATELLNGDEQNRNRVIAGFDRLTADLDETEGGGKDENEGESQGTPPPQGA